jgi:hypothetical protein
MKASFYALAILIIAGAGFFTFQHSRKFEDLQKVRLETIKENKSVSANAAATESDLKKERADRASFERKKEELTQRISALKSTGAAHERDVAELDNSIKGQDEEFAELDKTLKEVQGILKALGDDVSLDNLADKIQVVTDDKKQKELKLEELNTLVSSADKLLASNRADVDSLVKRDLKRNANIGRNSMEAVVSSVNQDWGFLVIGAGSNTGFTPQTSLIIKRDGRVLGRVQPSSIEPGQTVAEIDLKSLAPGVRIQPGDRVILEKPITR